MAFNPADYPERSLSGPTPTARIQPGKHHVKIISVDFDSSKQTLAVTFSALDNGATIRGWYPTSGARGWITRDLCKAVRWPHTFEETSPASRDHVLLNQELQIVVVEEDWEGKTRLKVKYTNRLAGFVENRSAPDQTETEEDLEVPF